MDCVNCGEGDIVAIMPTVLSDIAPLCVFTWYAGISPIVCESDGMRVSMPMLVCTVGYHVLLVVLNMYLGVVLNDRYEGTPMICVLALEIVSGFLTIFCCLLALCRTGRLNCYLNKVSIVNSILEQRGCRTDFSRRTCFCALPVAVVFVAIAIRIFFAKSLSAVSRELLSYASYAYIPLHMYQLRGFLAVLSSRMSAVIRMLDCTRTLNGLCELSRCHFLLCASAEVLGAVLSPIFLSVTMMVFATVVGELYCFFISFPNYLETSVSTLWVVYGVIFYFVPASECTLITTQAKEFNSRLHNIIIQDKSSILRNNQHLSLYISLKKEVTFTAFGLFTFDYSLFHLVLSGALTYLVILVQVEQISTRNI